MTEILALPKLEACADVKFIITQALTHYHTMTHFDTLEIYSCGKHCEKRRNCL